MAGQGTEFERAVIAPAIRHRISLAVGALACVTTLFVSAASAQAAGPLTATQRQELTKTLDSLAASHAAIAAMVTECNGGMIMVFACPAPMPSAKPSSGCNVALDSCELVAALHDTDAAIDDLQKTLSK